MCNIDNIKINTDINDIVKYIDHIFEDSLKIWASDIHIEPTKDFVLIRYRLDGSFIIKDKLSNDNFASLITRYKVLWSLKIDESRIPQDWKIAFKSKETWEEVDIRLSTLPTNQWEKIVMRLLRQDASLLDLNKLWFIDHNLSRVKEVLKSKYWIILVAWPTWSWKSTTLFSLLKYFNPLEKNISTLEDPVEYNINYINQSQIAPQKWFTFASWLKSLLRQDPDIIMVWEIRDKETAVLSTEAALTWHLVLSTIHTNSASWTIQRLMNMWIESFLISSSLKMVISQRLVKKICPSCKVKLDVSDSLKRKVWSYLDWIIDADIDDIIFYHWEWCDSCWHTWYKWRIWVHEVLVMSSDLEQAILNNASDNEIKKIAMDNWMLTIVQDALLNSVMWNTTLEEAFKLV